MKFVEFLNRLFTPPLAIWTFQPAISMNCDNQTVITKVNNSKDNMKSTRHVKRRSKTVRKLRNSGVIALDYVHTSKNLADEFTKGLSRNVIDSALSEMGLRPTRGLPWWQPILYDRRSRELEWMEKELDGDTIELKLFYSFLNIF